MQQFNMKQKEEYKETELGFMPKSWKIKNFDECINKEKTKVGKINKQEFKNFGKHPIIDQGQSLIAGYWDKEDDVYQGDLPVIIFGDHTRILKYIEFPFVCGADGTKVIVSNLDVVNPKFFYYALKSIEIPSRGYNRHYSLLKEKKIACPPITEQKKIFYVLSTIQEAKEKTENVINSLKELKKSLMKHLFTYGPVSLEETEKVKLKETEIGEVSEGWKVNNIGELYNVKQGKQISAKESKEGKTKKPFLRTSNLTWGKINISKVDSMYFTKEKFEKLKLKKGDILTCEGGDIGRTAIYDDELEECAYQNHLHRLRPKTDDTDNLFFVYWMNHAVNQRKLYVFDANRTTIPNLSGSRLKNFKIPKPELSKQQQISSILSTIDAKIESEENRKNALEELFKSMLHNLMSAKIRVNNLEI